MASDFYFYKDLNDGYEQIRSDADKIAIARARYRVQEDFNRELVDEIAAKTGHENLAETCFADISLDSHYNLDVNIYNDWRVIDGLYKSMSSYHQSGDKWQVVTEHHGMSKGEFWERKSNGERTASGENYGIVDPEWIADNFWDGIYHATNGWPLGNAEFLQVHTYKETSAESIIISYYNRYVRSYRFQKYIQEEINAMRN